MTEQNAQTREELLKIQETYGELTPDVVVEAAAHPSHPLHDRFTWDDEEAARRQRESDA